MPRGVYERNKEFEVTEAPQNHKDRDFSALSGDVIQEVEVTGDVYSLNDKAEKLKFLEEPVRVFLYEGGKNDMPFVHLQVNGECALPGNDPRVMRGQEHTLKRKFVESLARMRSVSYSQPFAGIDAARENVYRPQVSVQYPFSVIQDPNPKGGAWLKSIMGQ